MIFVAYLLIDNNILNLKTKLYKNYPNIQIRKDIFNKKSIVGNINNDYNIKFLPYTEFEKVSFRTVKINFQKNITTLEIMKALIIKNTELSL